MTYLGLDLAATRELTGSMRLVGADFAAVRPSVLEAQRLSELAADVVLQLDQVDEDLRVAARRVEMAGNRLAAYEIDASFAPARHVWPTRTEMPEPVRTPTPLPAEPKPDPLASTQPTLPADPLWQAHPLMRWNLVRQESSHNSYLVAGGMGQLYRHGVRSFELDIHRGAPTDFTPWTDPVAAVSPLLAIAYDHANHDGGVEGDWRVYHVSGHAQSEYELLSEGLKEIAELAHDDPITLFVDVKDPFGGDHPSRTFDALVRSEFGDRLYTPADLLARAPGARNVQQVVTTVGWPTVSEMQGRVLVVLTGDIDEYDVDGPAAFIAPAPDFRVGPQTMTHLPNPDAVFYNAEFSRDGEREIRAIQARGSMVRTYFNPRCGPPFSTGDGAPLSAANFRSVDIEFGHEGTCRLPMPPPAESAAVPG